MIEDQNNGDDAELMDSDGDSQRLLSDDKMEDLENEALMALNNHESINGGGRRSID